MKLKSSKMLLKRSSLTSNDLRLLSRNFPRISSGLEENFSRLSKIVPRYLYSSTISTGFSWMVLLTASASGLCLFPSLVLFTVSSREEAHKLLLS